ncbi:hypothetical protein ACFL02_09155, partial [Planctomycetota bacterium]
MERKQRKLLMVLAMVLAVGVLSSIANADRIVHRKLEEISGAKGLSPTNQPPNVDAGLPQVKHLPDFPGSKVTFVLNGSVTDDTVFGPNELEWHWEKFSGPGAVIFEPNIYDLNATAEISEIGIYELVLSASDGVYEANDICMCAVLAFGHTGEVIRYTFDGHLNDTGGDSQIPDHLEAKRYTGLDTNGHPIYVPATAEYSPGIDGPA